MEKHYNEDEVMTYQKNYGGIHSKESRAMVKAWADSKGITYNTRGQFPEKIFMAWIDEHAGQPVEVVDSWSYRYHGEICRQIQIRCNYCAELHVHGSMNLGVREDESYRVPHCSGPYGKAVLPNYQIVDNTPVEEWELKAVHYNESHK